MRDRQDGSDVAFADRFLREARALARLSHPNIVAVYDFGEAGGYHFLLMEYVDGLSLRQLIQSRKISTEEALAIVPKICDALQCAHEQGIVHRDIKPDNILLDKEGRVKIADFGIAKIIGQQHPSQGALTQDRQQIGTPQYMAPEQIEKPLEVDHRADIYSLGVVFYEMLTGELPLGKFQSPSQKTPMDARLDEVVLHALEKEPAQRYQMASQVKTDVETIAKTPPGIPPFIPGITPKGSPLPQSMSNLWKIAAVGIFGFLVLAVFLCGALLFFGVKKKTPVATASLMSSNLWNLLNENQRQVAQWTEEYFPQYLDARTFDGWSSQERTDLEKRSLDDLKAPLSTPYYQAINTLAALGSTNALPAFRTKAFSRPRRLLRSEASNRGRWMAIRALGLIGDKSAVPEMIHLTYHNQSHTRWWAQISLVRLTGQNFGSDWQAWGTWWNSQHGQPPFNPEMIQWHNVKYTPSALAIVQAEGDRKFLQSIAKKIVLEEQEDQEPLPKAPLSTDSSQQGRKLALQEKFDQRTALDRKKYTQQQLVEVENLYQVASRKNRSPDSNESLKKMIEKYPDLNRTGCAILYLAQNTAGQESEKHFKNCIQNFNDCYYGDGVQVGAYARFCLANYYKQARENEKARKLYKEIQDKYPDSVDHQGRLLIDLIK